jgi:hypothetical protein
MSKRIRFLVYVGPTYLVIGLISAMVTNPLEPGLVKTGLRLTVFAVSLAIFVFHIRREVRQFDNPARSAALGVTGAVMIGTFSIALYANVSAVQETGEINTALLSTLIIWPLVTGTMAFGAAFVLAKMITRATRQK